MYQIELETGWIRDEQGNRFMQDPSDPKFIAYQEWLLQGNEPEILVLGGAPDDFILSRYVDRVSREMLPPESWNWKTSTLPPLRKEVERRNGWLVLEKYFGYNSETNLFDVPCVEMSFERTFDAGGFVQTILKQMVYYNLLGSPVIVKTFPPEDVSYDASRLGAERRQALVDELMLTTLKAMIPLFAAMPPQDLSQYPIALPPPSQDVFVKEILEIGRSFVASLGVSLTRYVNFHTAQDLRDAIQNSTDGWLNVIPPASTGITTTLKVYLQSRIT